MLAHSGENASNPNTDNFRNPRMKRNKSLSGKREGMTHEMFSRRLPRDISENPITEALAELRRQGTPMYDLTQANPTQAGFRYPTEEIATALADAAHAPYEPHPRGLSMARAAIARYYADAGCPVDAEQIHCAASSSDAYGMLFRLLCDPGDAVCIPAPTYPLFSYLAALDAVTLRQYTLRRTPFGGWRIAIPSLEDAITERCRAVIVVSPSNSPIQPLSPSPQTQGTLQTALKQEKDILGYGVNFRVVQMKDNRVEKGHYHAVGVVVYSRSKDVAAGTLPNDIMHDVLNTFSQNPYPTGADINAGIEKPLIPCENAPQYGIPPNSENDKTV